MSRKGTIPASYHLATALPFRRWSLVFLSLVVPAPAENPRPEATPRAWRWRRTLDALDRRPRSVGRAGRAGRSRRRDCWLDSAGGRLLLPAKVVRDLRHHAARLVFVAVRRRLGAT